MTTNIDDILYSPIPTTAPYKTGDVVTIYFGKLQPFAAIVCVVLDTWAVEIWANHTPNVSTPTQFWLKPGPDCRIDYIRPATIDELYAATAKGMRLTV